MTEIAELSFEEAFRALEEAVRQLEEGDLKLEQAITLYERGMRLAKRCGDALDQAELQVQQLGMDEGQQVEVFPGKAS